MFTRERQWVEISYRLQRCEAQNVALEARLKRLTEAYDDLFDFLAKEVGFEGARGPFYITAGSTVIPMGEGPISPRELRRTTPASEVVRTTPSPKGA